MPLRHLVEYLGEMAGEVVFIGIQPGSMRMGAGLSPAVESARKRLIGLLRNHELDLIPKLL